MPERIQLRRTKGWRKPEAAVVVARPSRWGNWYKVTTPGEMYVSSRHREALPRPDAPIVVVIDKHGHRTGQTFGGFDDKRDATVFAVDMFRRSLMGTRLDLNGLHHHDYWLGPLRGKDLACWCPLDEPCHADVLLALANAPVDGEGIHPMSPATVVTRNHEGVLYPPGELVMVVDDHNTGHALRPAEERGVFRDVTVCGLGAPDLRLPLDMLDLLSAPWELLTNRQYRAWAPWPCQTCCGITRRTDVRCCGTCAHLAREHTGPDAECDCCDCPEFIPEDPS